MNYHLTQCLKAVLDFFFYGYNSRLFGYVVIFYFCHDLFWFPNTVLLFSFYSAHARCFGRGNYFLFFSFFAESSKLVLGNLRLWYFFTLVGVSSNVFFDRLVERESHGEGRFYRSYAAARPASHFVMLICAPYSSSMRFNLMFPIPLFYLLAHSC